VRLQLLFCVIVSKIEANAAEAADLFLLQNTNVNQVFETAMTMNSAAGTRVGLDNVQYFESSTKLDDIKKQLEMGSEREKMDGMKRLIAVSKYLIPLTCLQDSDLPFR